MRLKADRPKPWSFLVKNLRNPRLYAEGLARTIPLLLRGYDADHVALYGIDRDNAAEYPPDFLNYRITTSTNRHVWPILHDKLLFDSFMRDRLPIIRLLGVASEGSWFDGAEPFGPQALREGLASGKHYVVKPLQGGGGTGVRFLGAEGPDLVRFGVESLPVSTIETLVRSLPYHGFYPKVAQHPDVARLFPNATNTLRVLMFRGAEDAEPRLLGAQLRVGNRTSAPLDSFFYQGGLSVLVDAQGTTVQAVQRDPRGHAALFTHHPDTGAPLVGVGIPYWDDVLDALLTFHRNVPAFDFVGWDVLLTPERPLIIEGNHNPGLRTLFAHKSLADLPEFRAFCEERGLLRL